MAGITIITETVIMKGEAGASAHAVSSAMSVAMRDRDITMVMTAGVVSQTGDFVKTVEAHLRAAMTGARGILAGSVAVGLAAQAHHVALAVAGETGVVVSAVHPHHAVSIVAAVAVAVVVVLAVAVVPAAAAEVEAAAVEEVAEAAGN